MINGYYYSTPMMNFLNGQLVIAVAAILAAVAGLVLFFTFFRKKNEGKYTGFRGRLYNLMNFNRFYAEEILRLVYIVLTCVVTVTGIITVILGSFLLGLAELVLLNLLLRVVFELLMMFIILCRKTVSVDRHLAGIEKYYDDGYDAFAEESEEGNAESEFGQTAESGGCSGACESCGADCGTDTGAEKEDRNSNSEEC